ncbi:fibroblast growth factor 1-like [Trichogramma pretiosum]|uniref:fibroblast growth factor 1-like n=1 Tax=Trichogramma pretiosum TaxID=7493 RepID=UPI000C71A6A0|nr:fibroblast growth factor 1-like [Trichogramma pretiosum]
MPSLRWIHENLEPPNVEEESSDIDDSCSSDDSFEGNNNRDDKTEAKSQLSRVLPNASLDNYQNGNPAVVASSHASIPWSLVHSKVGQKPLQLKLLARTGYCVGIDSLGRVAGVDADDNHARLFVRAVADGIVRLQSAETGRYLAFNSTGRLYGELNMNNDSNEWEQWSIGNYSAFRSHRYAELDWWLAIKRNGRQLPGPKSLKGHTTAQFLPIVL